MVQVARFLGIIISMYHKEHAPPHFHAEYNEHEAQIGIRDFQVIRGKLPPKVL
jgi:Domain of unknown function (DUF4160)